MTVTVGAFTRVFDPSAGRDEPWYVNDHTIVRGDDGTWHLIGITHPEPADPHHEVDLCHATAPSLLGPWTRHEPALTADGDHAEHLLWAPHVVAHDGRWWMFVCAGGDAPDRFGIHVCTSEDLWTWERHPANPVVVDGYEARDPMVRRVGDRWVMYYTATLDPSGGPFVVAAAESDDLVRWEGRHVVYQDPCEGTFGGPTESPFVVERDGTWYLFIGPDWARLVADLERTGRYDPAGYLGTRVLASDDPFDFGLEGQVGFLATHATEVVRDEAGAWWVTHCGWGQGGVFLAPLDWDGS